MKKHAESSRVPFAIIGILLVIVAFSFAMRPAKINENGTHETADTQSPQSTEPLQSILTDELQDKQNNVSLKNTVTALSDTGSALMIRTLKGPSLSSDQAQIDAAKSRREERFWTWVDAQGETWDDIDPDIQECARSNYVRGMSWTPHQAMGTCFTLFEIEDGG